MLEYSVLKQLFVQSRVMMCGDVFQTIYEWRGSVPYEVLEDFRKSLIQTCDITVRPRHDAYVRGFCGRMFEQVTIDKFRFLPFAVTLHVADRFALRLAADPDLFGTEPSDVFGTCAAIFYGG